MTKQIFVLFLLGIITTQVYGVSAKKIKPIGDQKIFVGTQIEYVLSAKDKIGLTYTQWSINGKNFKKRYKKIPKSVKVSCVGERTLSEAKKCQLLDQED